MSKGKILHVFFNSLVNCRYTFRNGKDANFLGGRYTTDNAAEIDELNHEISEGHPHIYVKEDERTIDTTVVDPMEAIRAKVRQELLAEMAANTAKDNDRGNYDVPEKLQGIVNSNDIAEGASGSSSSDAPPPATATASPVTAPAGARVIIAGSK
jgi:hypothetical protein